MRAHEGQGCASASSTYLAGMKIKIVVHETGEGGFRAEVPALPGCASQGETMDELIAKIC